MFNVNAYDYNLPEELIAEYPAVDRASSSMLVMERTTGNFKLKTFSEIIDYLSPGDCVVVNDTKVLKARLFGKKEGGGAEIEAMLISPVVNKKYNCWNCFIKPGKRVKPGTKVKLIKTKASLDSDIWYTVLEHKTDGSYEIQFDSDNVDYILEAYGNIPLPPYIKRNAAKLDEDRYQTVYSNKPGAVAAPTAGLHFTDEILEKIRQKGVKRVDLTLHVGAGTFKPVSVENIKDHKMHTEEFFLSESAAAIINKTKAERKKILAVGTTSTRVLETLGDRDGTVKSGYGWTDIFIHPPYKPKVVDMLLTNFHLPKSTLIMLVSSFSTRENVLKAYKFGIDKRLRFYSYGDCMLLV